MIDRIDHRSTKSSAPEAEGAAIAMGVDPEAVRRAYRRLKRSGMERRDILAELSRRFSLRRNQLYRLVIKNGGKTERSQE